MFDTSHHGRADLVLAVPRGFDPINLPTTWLATDRRDHLPLMMEVRLHLAACLFLFDLWESVVNN